MKCCSRSTLGVIIGSVNILFYLGCTIVVIGLISTSNSSHNSQRPRLSNDPLDFISHGDDNGDDIFALGGSSLTRDENIAWGTFLLSTIISACLVMIIISGLLIVGIVKRRHNLMWPWLALSGIALVCSCFRVVSSVIVGLANGMAVQGVLILLIAGVLGAGVQALILWPIFTLCRDIMAKNNVKPGQVMHGVHYSYVPPDAPPQYSYYNSGLPQKS